MATNLLPISMESPHGKGHKKSSCLTLKNLIQDLIEQGDILVDNSKGKTNVDRTIFKTPLQDHGKGKASSL